MRSTRITVLGIVVFLFLPILSGCLRIDLRCKPKYDIDEDSVFFSKMPPRTENGANIVAFELDGKPYVFPKEGMIPSLFQAPIWYSDLEEKTKNDTTKWDFIWMALRRHKKYNPHLCLIRIPLLQDNLLQKRFVEKGFLELGDCRSECITFEITKHDHSRNLICGRFSGVLKIEVEKDFVETKRIENGFFDLTYTIVKVPDVVVQ